MLLNPGFVTTGIPQQPFSHAFLNHIPHPCLVVTADWRHLLYCNQAFDRLWQSETGSELCFEQSFRQQAYLHFRDSFLACPPDMQQTQAEITLADSRVFAQTISSIHIAEINQAAYLCVFEDITRYKKREAELTQAKAQLEEALAAKQTYLSTMTHELRTPLNAVIAMAHLLAEDNPHPHQTDNLKTLKHSADNLLTLINDVLDFSKIEANKLVFEKTAFSLEELLKNARRSSQYRADEKGIRLETRKASHIPAHLVGDPARLLQILNNLISNAVKFTEKGVILIEAELDSKTESQVGVRFIVSDTGIGIPQEKLQTIFEDYTQAGNDITRKFGGTGLGLAITKRLLELQNSRIEVKSQVGLGSSFSFVLLFGIGDKPESKPVSHITKHAHWKQAQLLLVEDNEVNIIVASKFLKSWGLQPDYARNGSEALEKVKEKNYDLVLMDIQMPVMDGFEATRVIRAMNRLHLQVMPIIALTANALADVKEKCLSNGMTDFVTKPFTPDALHTCLSKYLPTPVEQAVDTAGAEPAEPVFVPDYAGYIWQKVTTVTSEDAETQQHLFKLSVESIRQFKADYQSSLLHKDSQRLSQMLHKARTLFHMLALEEIELEARQGFQLLSETPLREDKLRDSIHKVHAFCDRILA